MSDVSIALGGFGSQGWGTAAWGEGNVSFVAYGELEAPAVAAVADIVAVSTILEVLRSAFDEVPANVCNAVKVVAVPGAT